MNNSKTNPDSLYHSSESDHKPKESEEKKSALSSASDFILAIWKKVTHKLSSPQIILLGFAALILLGSFLLMTPLASADHVWTPFLDALFTATSASCVTGLVVHDTATYWSGFGQFIVLLLIQIGGMGVITIALAFSLLSGKKIGLKERGIMQDSISAPQIGGIVELTGFIIRTIFLIEGTGALLLMPVFLHDHGFFKAIWYSIFHSISAFCNGGFDLQGFREQYSSLTSYAAAPLINIVIMLLILIGGIGFMTWNDVRNHKLQFKRYSLQSKVVLTASLFLVFVPAILFFFFELGDKPLGERILASLFQSVTLRTAGFNTADLDAFSDSGKALMIILMLTGGASGSTAGGAKISTFVVVFATVISVFKREEHTNLFNRRVEDDTVRNAAVILTIYITLFMTAGCIISRIEGIDLLTCLFETSSAVATVGLTLGITPGLGSISRIILIILMYLGRVGSLTLVFAVLPGNYRMLKKLPQEKLTVG